MAVDRIRSVCDDRSNGALIAQVAPLWIRPDDVLVDVTYGRGLWHTDYLHPGPMTRHDLGLAQDAVDPDGVDFRHLPEPDGSVDVVLFDPTYVAPGGRETSTLAARGADMWDRYGMLTAGRTPAENHEIIAAGVAEIARVLRRPRQQDDGIRDGCGGRLLVKAMDYVCGGQLNPGTDWIKTAAAANCLRYVDQVVHLTGPGPQPQNGADGKPRTQHHTWSVHSVLLVFQRTKGEPVKAQLELIESAGEEAALGDTRRGDTLGLLLWGSDCDDCGNATAGSMTCDSCGSDANTRALWISPPPSNVKALRP